MADWKLSDNLANICRLCLQTDDFIVDIFHRLDPNPKKKPLPERIYDLYQVKVSKTDGLPTNICHRCLYFTESFTEFRDNVRKCEARLQSYIASLGILGSVRAQFGSPKNGIKTEEIDNIEEYSNLLPDENSLVTVVDPNQDYESSDEDFSIDSDNEYAIHVPQLPEEEKKDDTNFNNLDGNYHMDALKNVFLCQYCDMAFTNQIECAEHESRHDAANPHSCNYCPYRCASRQTVIAHIKEMHDNDRPYVCVQCNKGFGRRSDLKKHTIVHTGIRPFTCPVCNKNFSRNTNLTKHLRIHTGLKPHVCQKCPRSFTTTADLIRHQRVHNDNNKPFQCKKCPSAFTRKDKFLHHEKMHQRKEKPTNGIVVQSDPRGMLLNQPELGGLGGGLSGGGIGIGTGLGGGGGGFDTESMVISLDPFANMNQATSEHIEQLQQKQQLQQLQHLKSTPLLAARPVLLPDEMFTAVGMQYSHPLTGDQLSHNQNFEISDNLMIEKFGTERSHICPVCSKAFIRKRELQRHSVIHTGVKPFACKVCNKRFNRKDKVVRHERIHTEEKFACSKCNLGFSKQEALDMHLKVHDLDKIPFPGEQHQIVPMEPPPMTFQRSLEEGLRPQLNFYSEIKPELPDN